MIIEEEAEKVDLKLKHSESEDAHQVITSREAKMRALMVMGALCRASRVWMVTDHQVRKHFAHGKSYDQLQIIFKNRAFTFAEAKVSLIRLAGFP